MLGVYHDDPALPTIRSQIYHLSLSSDNISRDIDILSGGLMVYQQAVSLFCLRMINTEINGNSEAVLISFDKSVKHDLDECNLYHNFCGFSKEFVIDGQPSEVFQP